MITAPVTARRLKTGAMVQVFKVSETQPAKPTGETLPPSGWNSSPPASGKIWASVATTVSDKVTGTWSTPTRWNGDNGDKGEQGVSGQVIRQSEWCAEVSYHNDGENITPIRYRDVVLIYATNGEVSRYACKVGHVSANQNKPSGAGNQYWESLSGDFPLYTPLLVAENGDIKLLQSNKILIQKPNGTVTAGISGNGEGTEGIRFWAGGSDPKTAAFRVDESGNGHFKGEIDTNSGKIGGFEITNGRIGKNDNENSQGLSLYDEYIKFKDYKGRDVIIGTINYLGYEYLGSFTDTYQILYPLPKVAFIFNIQNGQYNHAFVGQGSGTLNGIMEGYKCQTVTPYTDTCNIPSLKNGNRILCRFSYSGGSVGLPILSDVQSSLSVGKNVAFTCRITFICIHSSYTGGIWGRNTTVTEKVNGVNQFAMNDYKYPQRLNNNATYQTGKLEMSVGDIDEFMLVYDGGNSETSYRAFWLANRH